jgi:hypothetical protein
MLQDSLTSLKMESRRKTGERTKGEGTEVEVNYRMCGGKSGAPPMRVSDLQALFESLCPFVPQDSSVLTI